MLPQARLQPVQSLPQQTLERAEAADLAFRRSRPWALPAIWASHAGLLIGPMVLLALRIGQGTLPGWAVPLMFIPVFSYLPLFLLIRHSLRRAYAEQERGPTCAGCGYDLRSCPSRCPECGRATCRIDAPPSAG